MADRPRRGSAGERAGTGAGRAARGASFSQCRLSGGAHRLAGRARIAADIGPCRSRRANRSLATRSPQGAPRRGDRLAHGVVRRSRGYASRRRGAPEPRLRRGARTACDHGGAAAAVSLSSLAVAGTRTDRAPVAAAPRRRSAAVRISEALWLTKRVMADKISVPAAAGAQLARPGVLSLNIRERAALYAAYMPFLRGGGIFIPTSRPYTLGEEVFMLLSLMDDPNRIAVQGKVVWITPEGVQGNRTQGIGVQFTQDETGATARTTIERILGESLASTRSTHTM